MNTHFLAVSLLVCALGLHNDAVAFRGDDDNSAQGLGTVVLTFQKGAFPGDVRTLTASLIKTGFASIRKSVAFNHTREIRTIQLDAVPIGLWSVTVEARSRSGAILYTGKSNVRVVPSQTLHAAVSITPATLTFAWGEPPIKWRMHADNPVLQRTSGEWDADHYYLTEPAILKLDGQYHMWYCSGYNRTVNTDEDEQYWIAHATSPDGFTWTKHGAVLNPGPRGSWMDLGPWGPTVIYDEGIFKMWFAGAKHPLKYANGIGYATSHDGDHWEVNRDPVVPTTSSMSATWCPAIVKKGTLYFMYIGACNSMIGYPYEVILMTSVDGIHWSSRGKVLEARRDVSWQSSGIVPCQVIYDENRFKMMYTGFSGDTFALGYTESAEGLNWDATSDLPTLTASDAQPMQLKAIGFAALLRDDGKLRMWFSGLSEDRSGYQIGYAEQVK
jgi:predicted GH43/DUF377 family glycosyl hydrolase